MPSSDDLAHEQGEIEQAAGNQAPASGHPPRVSRRRALLGLAGVGVGAVLGFVGWQLLSTDSRQRWKITISDVDLSYAPLVTAGIVCVRANTLANSSTTLHAIDADSGQSRWQDSFDGVIAAAADGVIYIPDEDEDEGDQILAVDAATGQRRWKAPSANGSAGSTYDINVGNGTAYIMRGIHHSPDGYDWPNDMDSELIAFDIATGRRRWGYSLKNKVLGLSVVADDIVYAGTANDDTVRAIDAVTGRELWKISTGSGAPTYTKPAVANGIVYVMSQNVESTYLYALNASNGEQQWKVSTGRMRSLEVIVANGTVYLPLAESRSPHSLEIILHALDAANGRQRWKAPIGRALYTTTLAVTDGVVYATGLKSDSAVPTLYAIDGATGVERWTFSVDNAYLISAPTVDHGVAYFGTRSGELGSGESDEIYAVSV